MAPRTKGAYPNAARKGDRVRILAYRELTIVALRRSNLVLERREPNDDRG
jgi:hypothetical protein